MRSGLTRVRGMPTERRVEVVMFHTPLPANAYLLSTRARPNAAWARPVPTPTRTLNTLEGCIQHAAATADPTQAAHCLPQPVTRQRHPTHPVDHRKAKIAVCAERVRTLGWEAASGCRAGVGADGFAGSRDPLRTRGARGGGDRRR
jgi:hypothetical protein